MTQSELKIFEKYLPAPSVQYCAQLWKSNNFLLRITKPRQSKLGDYCYSPSKGHAISVNANLNPYSFLITYLHEVAHLMVQKKYLSRKLDPHGKQWQEEFQLLLKPIISEQFLPENIQTELINYYKAPTASTGSHAGLTQALRQFDYNAETQITLDQLTENETFSLNGRIFVKGPLRRTRFFCKEVKSNKNYIILAKAIVQKVV